jgi:hypothetical protein
VFVCESCEQEFDREDKAKEHDHDGAPIWLEGSLCLCGASLINDDFEPSLLLGTEIRCARCRDKIAAGIPSGEAVRQSFAERGLRVR